MKTPSDELFVLIKALSPSEKRYFKVEVVAREKGANTAYYKLFDAIDKQEEYDEEELLRKHANERFAKHFAMAKKYLFDNLLSALNSYNRSNSTFHDIQEKISSAMLLHSRGLHTMSKKMIRTAKKTAKEREVFLMLIQAIRQEIVITQRTAGTAHEEECAQLYNELEEAQEILRLDSEYLRLQELSLSSYFSSTYSRDNNDALDEFLRHPLLQEENKPREHSLRMRYHSTISRINFIKGEYETAFLHAKASVEAIEQLPHQIRENPMVYLPQLHNLCNRCLKVGRYDELEAILQKIRSVPTTTPQAQRFMYESLFGLELNYYAYLSAYDKAYALLPAIEKADAVWSRKVRGQHRLALLYTAMNICIYMGDYRRALMYSNHILNEPPMMMQLYSFTKVISIIIHSELHNHDILDATIRSTYRHLKKQGHLFRVEEIILKYLRRLGSITDRATLHTLLREIRSELQEAITDPGEARALEYFDFVLWIDARLQDTSIHEYKAGQRKVAEATV